MKKVSSKKHSKSSKLARVFFSKKESLLMPQDTAYLNKEIEALREQVKNLKAAISTLQTDSEEKDVRLAKLAREKEKLSMELSKTKRCNASLVKQLEEERKFYFKEKIEYCKEMNEMKKLKKVYSHNSLISTPRKENREEAKKLKANLEKIMQANYTLSVKFLKMRDAKNHISSTLRRTKEEQRKVVGDLRAKIESLKKDLDNVLNQKTQHQHISPSNKKYLTMVNQNSSLVYENLCLQMQIDQLNNKLKRNKSQQSLTKTIDNNNKSSSNQRHHHSGKATPQLIKIFERQKTNETPHILNETRPEIVHSHRTSNKHQKHNSKSKSLDKIRLPEQTDSKLAVFQVSQWQSPTDSTANIRIKHKRSLSAPKIVQSVRNISVVQ